MASTPAATDFVISQGDSLPLMRIPIAVNSQGQLVDLDGCTVTFLGRIYGTRTYPPPIIRPIESYAQETEDGDSVIAVYVHLTTTDTSGIKVPSNADYVQMQGELEIIDADGEVLTIPSIGYLSWWIRDDVGDAGT